MATVGVKELTVLGCGVWLCCRWHIPVCILERLRWLCVDYESNLLFWVDTKQHVVVSSDLNGRKRSILLTSTHMLHHAIAVTVFEVMTAAHSKLQQYSLRDCSHSWRGSWHCCSVKQHICTILHQYYELLFCCCFFGVTETHTHTSTHTTLC